MKIKSTTKGITFTGIANESQLEDVTVAAVQAKCVATVSEYSTKITS